MLFRTIPPDASELSPAKLLWPPVLIALIALFAWLTELSGHRWNIHGDAVAMLLAFGVSLFAGVVSSIVTLSSVLPALQRYPSLRSQRNLLSAGISVLFVAGAIAFIAFAAFRLSAS